MTADIGGGCLCAAVRYVCLEPPIASRLCWCRHCQFLAAGNATVNVAFSSASVTIRGTLTDYRSIADSGTIMHRRFCGTCGTPLFSEAESRPHLIFIRAGTLDEPHLARPSATIWTSRAPPWACIDPHLTCYEGQPPPAA